MTSETDESACSGGLKPSESVSMESIELDEMMQGTLDDSGITPSATAVPGLAYSMSDTQCVVTQIQRIATELGELFDGDLDDKQMGFARHVSQRHISTTAAPGAMKMAVSQSQLPETALSTDEVGNSAVLMRLALAPFTACWRHGVLLVDMVQLLLTIVHTICFTVLLCLDSDHADLDASGWVWFAYAFDALQWLELRRLRSRVPSRGRRVHAWCLVPADAVALLAGSARGWLVLRLTRLSLLVWRPAAYMSRLQRRLNFYPNQATRRFLKFIALTVALSHGIACCWLLVGTSWDDKDTVVGRSPPEDLGWTRYLRSYYWATVTCTTLGYGDITPDTTTEMLFCLCVICIGVVVAACVIANMTSMLYNTDAASLEIQRRRAAARQMISSLPNSLGLKAEDTAQLVEHVDAAFDSAWEERRGLAYAQLWGRLPPCEAFALRLTLAKASILGAFAPHASPELLVTIVERMTLVHKSTSTVLCSRSQVPSAFFLISSGNVLVSTESNSDGGVSLRMNDSVGLDDMLLDSPRYSVHAMCTTDCTLFRVSAEDVRVLEQAFPEQMQGMRARIRREQAAIMERAAAERATSDAGQSDAGGDTSRRASANFSLVAVRSMMEVATEVDVTKMTDVAWQFRLVHVWSLVRLFLTLYYTLLVPYRLAFHSWDAALSSLLQPGIAVWTVCDVLADAVCLVEFLSGRSQANVVRGRSTVELFSVMPLDYVALLASAGNLRVWTGVRMLKLLRLALLKEDMIEVRRAWPSVALKMSGQAWRVLEQVVITVLLAHIVSCCWYLIGEQSPARESWIARDAAASRFEHLPLLRAWYWTITTITTQGYGDIVPASVAGTCFALVVIVLGATLYPGLVANISALVIGNRHSPAVAHQTKTERVLALMETLRLPATLRGEITRVLDSEWELLHGVGVEQIMSQLPEHEQGSLRSALHRPVLGSQKVFAGCGDEMLGELGSMVQHVVVPTGRYVYRHGDEAESDGMYVVLRGTVSLLDATGAHVLSSAATGSLFGHIEAVTKQRRRSSARAEGDALVGRIDCGALGSLLARFPSDSERLASNVAAELETESSAKVAQNLRSGKLAKMLTANEDESSAEGLAAVWRQRWLFYADDVQLLWWRVLMIGVGIYFCFSISYPLSFSFDSIDTDAAGLAVLAVDALCDVLLWADLWLTVVHTVHASLALQPVRVLANLPKRAFALPHWKDETLRFDLASALPLDWLLFGTPLHASLGIGRMQLRMLLRLPRLIRVARLRTYALYLREYIVDRRAWVSSTVYNLTRLLFLVLLSAYLLGCAWYVVGLRGAPTEGWTQDDVSQAPALRSLYWALTTMNTVGFGDISADSALETVYAMLVMVIGTGVFAVVVAILASVVASSNETAALFQRKQEALRRFGLSYALPAVVMDRAHEHLAGLWDCCRGAEPSELLDELPPSIKLAILSHLVGGKEDGLPREGLFGELSAATRRALLHEAKLEFFASGATVLDQQDCSHSVRWLVRGTVAVRSDADQDGNDAVMRGRHLLFAEHAVLGRPCPVSVIATTPCMTVALPVEVLQGHECASVVGAAKERLDGHSLSVSSAVNRGVRSSTLRPSVAIHHQVSWWVILPGSVASQLWRAVVFVALVGYLVAVPWAAARAAVDADDEGMTLSATLLALAYLMDAVMLADCVLQACALAVREPSGVYVHESRELRARYLGTGGEGRVDVLALAPVEVLAVVLGTPAWAYLRCWRLLRLHSLPRRVHEGLGRVMSEKALRLVKVALVFMSLMHVLACAWLAVRGMEDKDVSYMEATYFVTVVLTSVGYGDVVPQTSAETVLTIVLILVGATLYAAMIAHLTSIFQSADEADAAASAATMAASQYGKARGMARRLRRRVVRRLVSHQVRVRGVHEGELLDDMPTHLRKGVLEWVVGDAVRVLWAELMLPRAVEEQAAGAFVRDLVASLRPWVLSAGDVLAVEGAALSRLYLVTDGTAHERRRGDMATVTNAVGWREHRRGQLQHDRTVTMPSDGRAFVIGVDELGRVFARHPVVAREWTARHG